MGNDFLSVEYFSNKKILFIGNKPVKQLTSDQIDLINSYDIIVRCNGMNNKLETGNRVDWWWLNVWNWNTIRNNVGDTKYDEVSTIFIDRNSRRLVNKDNLYLNFQKLDIDKVSLVYTSQSPTELYDQSSHWKVDRSCTVPTTDVICLSYLVNKFPYYEITLTCLDIEDREDLLSTHPNWSSTWHCNVGGLERDYIKQLISEDRLKYVEFEQ